MRQTQPFISRLSTQHLIVFLATLLLTGCNTGTITTPIRVALLAPFEGRYREVGYNALYAARLALQDADATHIELLPIDDGGTSINAIDRARALIADPQVHVVLALGFAATDANTLATLDGIPALVIGNWGAHPVGEHVFVLSNPKIKDLLTIPPHTHITDAAQLDTPVTGDDVLSHAQISNLRTSLDGISMVSSAALPDPDFAERYTNSDQFAPEPGLLASLTYDATRIAVEAIDAGDSRRVVSQTLSSIIYTGLNGEITFENGYWRNAPIHTYQYDENGALLAVDRIVE